MPLPTIEACILELALEDQTQLLLEAAKSKESESEVPDQRLAAIGDEISSLVHCSLDYEDRLIPEVIQQRLVYIYHSWSSINADDATRMIVELQAIVGHLTKKYNAKGG